MQMSMNVSNAVPAWLQVMKPLDPSKSSAPVLGKRVHAPVDYTPISDAQFFRQAMLSSADDDTANNDNSSAKSSQTSIVNNNTPINNPNNNNGSTVSNPLKVRIKLSSMTNNNKRPLLDE
jgi:hypothetical protein